MIYLSGPISDPDPIKQGENLKNMTTKANALRSKGLEVFDPAELEVEGGATWEFYLIRDLVWIFENKPSFYFMKGWEKSRGCRLEHELANYLKLPTEYE